LLLIGPPLPILLRIDRASLFEGVVPAFPLRKARGTAAPKAAPALQAGTPRSRARKGVARSTRPQARYLYDRRCVLDDGQPIGHDRVPTVFWGSKEPGARNGSSRTVPTALILMGDWCVPDRGTTTMRNENRDAYDGQSQRLRRFQAVNLTKKDSPREFFRLTTRGLMGDPFSGLAAGHWPAASQPSGWRSCGQSTVRRCCRIRRA